MRSKEVKLRKLARVKARKFRTRNPRLGDYLQLYWNYWFQCHHQHACLWAMN